MSSLKPSPHRRQSDSWLTPFIAIWDWIDRRNIDLHLVLATTLWLTWDVINWAMNFADNHPDMDGVKMSAIIASVLTPWSLMQAAMFGFYANARKNRLEVTP